MLCNRLAIMAKGELKCIGYIQSLKSKFGKGFSLVVKLKQSATPVISLTEPDYGNSPAMSSMNCNSDVEEIKKEVKNEFDCSIRDEHNVSIGFDWVNC